MDNIFLNSFFFAVPIRLIWDNWQKFNGEQTDPGDPTDYLVPQVSAPGGGVGWAQGSIADYFGLPLGIGSDQNCAFPFRAYNLIWNEWFRDQNLQDSVTVPRGDGPDGDGNYTLLRRGKRHDYFTSCLPWPQKGTAVDIPLGTSAPVVTTSADVTIRSTASPGSDQKIYLGASPAGSLTAASGAGGGVTDFMRFGSVSGLETDLTSATAATVNQLREAFQVQRMYERDARGGTRYTEIIKAHFGVTSPDARLQRPEFLGGGQSVVNIASVPQTSSTDGTSPQGNLAAYGHSVMSGHGFSKSFTEHCVIIGLVSARADLTYQQGVERMWSRQTRFDFYWPALSHLGEQAVLSKEIYKDGTAGDEDVFGYQERFAEYRYKPSRVTALFRSSASGTLDAWHLAQDFSARPVLNASFIVDNPPIARVISVPSQPHFLFDVYFDMKCARPMPVYGVPGLIDHF